MTAIVPRRLFDDFEDDAMQPQPNTMESEPQSSGMVRACARIPVEFNERLKAMARGQGKTAEQLIGELLMELRPVLDQWEAKQEAARLRERFGPNFLNLLATASSPSQPQTPTT
ncbi:MAG: hypothetical protein VKM34_10760 [Cyanobacteriota bacterium]|nr:hypothetical protein [Cyanobacteriota bacterium]